MDWKVVGKKLENVDTSMFGDVDLYIVYVTDNNDKPILATTVNGVHAVRRRVRDYIRTIYSWDSYDSTHNIELDQQFSYETPA